jgi:hypothetical protein
MIEKVVRKASLRDFSEIRENLAFWLSKTPAERVGAVEILRRQRYGDMGRIQKCVRVIRINTSGCKKRMP